MKRLKFLLLLLLLTLPAWASDSQEVIVVPEHDLLEYNSSDRKFIPFIKEDHNPKDPIYLIWDFEKYHGWNMRIEAVSEVSVFINNRLYKKAAAGERYDFDPERYYLKADTASALLVSIYGSIKGGTPQLLAGKKNLSVSDDPLIAKYRPLNHLEQNTVLVFFILTFLLIWYNITPLQLLKAVVNIGADGPDQVKPFFGVLKMILLNSIIFGYLIFRYTWYAGAGDMLKAIKEGSENLAYFYSMFLVAFFLLLKMIYSKSLEKFFLDKVQLNISVSFMSMLFCAGYLCFFMIFISSFSYYYIPFISLKNIMYIIFSIQIVWLINLSVSSFKWSKTNNLYLFSYLCMAEIMPVALFLKAMKEFVF